MRTFDFKGVGKGDHELSVALTDCSEFIEDVLIDFVLTMKRLVPL
jgi:hypothetical protein